MAKKKIILFVLLTIFLAYGSVTATYAYFSINKTVSDNMDIELGDIEARFADSGGVVIDSKIVNVQGMLPGDQKETVFNIKNTGSLTNKVVLSFSDISGNGAASLLPYLNCRVIIAADDSERTIGEWIGRIISLTDVNGNPILIKPGDSISGRIIITLDKDTPYSEENKTLNFNLNIYASQPNDADWHTN